MGPPPDLQAELTRLINKMTRWLVATWVVLAVTVSVLAYHLATTSLATNTEDLVKEVKSLSKAITSLDEQSTKGAGQLRDGITGLQESLRAEVVKTQDAVTLIMPWLHSHDERRQVPPEVKDGLARIAFKPGLAQPLDGGMGEPTGIQKDGMLGYKVFPPAGTPVPVRSMASGRVASVAADEGDRNRISIDHGFGFATIYGRLIDVKVKEGDFVRKEQVIASVKAGPSDACLKASVISPYDAQPLDPRRFIKNK